MNIHEYQAKALLRSFGMPVPDGRVATSAEDAASAARELAAPLTVVKAQIHAGGRGAGHFAGAADDRGGVRLARSAEEAGAAAHAMLKHTLVTKQTGPQGRIVRKVYIESGCDIARELYLSLLVDRANGRIAVVASSEGGMEIEDVAAAHPERILKASIDPALGLCDYQSRDLAVKLGLKGRSIRAFQKVVRAAYDAFCGLDAAIVEINPLIVTGSGDLLALDAKMSFDDSALYRHPLLAELRDEDEEDPREREAARHGLAYVGLDGSIGCMVNGAGLAMATMDIIKMEGESPANFLDVGGGATTERVAAAFRILMSDPKVRGILVNIFGGIMRCDVIAEAIIAASRDTGLNVPLVVRLAGTNVERGRALLAESGLTIIPADDLGDAARKIVAAVRTAGAA
ncbi:ADP-forming succinate--CoA ligase subunit beta [Gluconacetobacter entanii]|uniref:ADP-forming succinate--CoA ligase subunit beta n=1 Tax=Gluconacetobacter entanii TaxID=108528 RepID=UPI001C932AD0|nr:ADP-forming succinate--CoA ligase subunit beta [Gluconacetobacter entanii]MBY4640752.1 ADP-forming succinate--CoA ligase subunit beta [Gluconacetobacter entanii]MCW4580962.1 ADP-forming succinate--CoA ligase subunit beta [Gluconacetobacter entanii]MCW4583387.1 ADP-forming succinate--CoA ligase subunit beta [Gluconacetobacter entanii]MCW4587617.1 ADP-forming succinate--CoA ligase subunit beta [Gluconacetobacter entanii]